MNLQRKLRIKLPKNLIESTLHYTTKAQVEARVKNWRYWNTSDSWLPTDTLVALYICQKHGVPFDSET